MNSKSITNAIHICNRLQKMEIKTEADDVDEGVSPNDLRAPTGVSATGAATRWMSPRIRKKLKHAKSFNKT